MMIVASFVFISSQKDYRFRAGWSSVIVLISNLLTAGRLLFVTWHIFLEMSASNGESELFLVGLCLLEKGDRPDPQKIGSFNSIKRDQTLVIIASLLEI